MRASPAVAPLHRAARLSALLLAAAVARPSPAAEQPSPVVVTCLGDSVAHSFPYGVGDPQEDEAKTYAGRLQRLLDDLGFYGDFTVVNNGSNGETAVKLEDKLNLDGATYDSALLDDDPDFVLLMIGGNDLGGVDLDGFPVSFLTTVETASTKVEASLGHIHGHINPDGGSPAVVLSAFIPNNIPDVQIFHNEEWMTWNPNSGIQTYNGTSVYSLAVKDLHEVALGDGDIYFYDNFTTIYDAATGKVHADPVLMSDDVHPNAAGYAIIADNWLEALAANYPAFRDSDGDRLSDAEEDTDGDGVWDEGVETNFNNSPDTDGDGLADLFEVACGSVATALNGSLKPSAVRVNFQPPRVSAPDGHVPDRGAPVSGSVIGWR